jgi:hypothetical protein
MGGLFHHMYTYPVHSEVCVMVRSKEGSRHGKIEEKEEKGSKQREGEMICGSTTLQCSQCTNISI